MRRTIPGTGVVLAGAAALGAYEAGVMSYVLDDLAAELDRPIRFDVLSGASAGAINVAAIAASADDPRTGVARLCDVWCGLRLDRVLRPSAAELLWMFVESGAGPAALRRAMALCGLRGGLLDPGPIRRLLDAKLPLGRIREQLQAGRLRGVSLAATHVASGRATLFYDDALGVPPWPTSANLTPMPTRLGIDHVMASASIPLLFPAVTIEGDLYCDGGLRQVVPLSPAIHLGAGRVLVVNPLTSTRTPTQRDESLRREAVASPLYLAGKALNALFVDRIDVDLARLDQITAIVRAGRRRFGPGFDAELNDELRAEGAAALQPIQTLRIEPSVDLGALAADYALRPAFARNARGTVGRLMRRLAEAGPTRAGDLLSYLMFDGGFAAELIAHGRADGRAQRRQLVELLADLPRDSAASPASSAI